MLSQAEIIY